MSNITLAIRFSDKTLATFKVHKSMNFKIFSNILYLLDEELLKKYLLDNNYVLNKSASSLEEHQDYEGQLAFFAPSPYGITYLDFVNKKVFDYNDYCGFTEVFALNIRTCIKLVLFYLYKDMDINIMELDNLDYNFYENAIYPSLGKNGYIDDQIFKNINTEHPYMFNFYQSFKKNIPIYFIEGNKKNGFVRTYFDVNTPSELFKAISELKDMTVVGIDVPEWEFISGTSRKAKKTLLPLLKEDFTFSTEELAAWKQN